MLFTQRISKTNWLILTPALNKIKNGRNRGELNYLIIVEVQKGAVLYWMLKPFTKK